MFWVYGPVSGSGSRVSLWGIAVGVSDVMKVVLPEIFFQIKSTTS